MKALIVEKYSPATYAFIEGLRAATGFAVDHLGNLEEALDFMVEKHLDTILVNVGHLGIDPCRATEAIRLRAKNSLVKCPQIILLSVVPLPLDEVGRCRGMQAMCMLRQFAPAVYEEVRAGFWFHVTRTRGSTIRIEHYQGHYYLDYVLGMFSEQIEVGDQPSRLAALLAGRRRSHLLETLADELEVCRQTIKKYMWELRHACLCAQRKLLVSELDENVFWMARGPGGTRCGISARIVWE